MTTMRSKETGQPLRWVEVLHRKGEMEGAAEAGAAFNPYLSPHFSIICRVRASPSPVPPYRFAGEESS